MKRASSLGILLVALAVAPLAARAADTFLKPTPEELAMKDLPGYPGVAAVVLYREEATIDDLHTVQHYDRIKVLTEEGKRYANVELRYVSLSDVGENDFSDNKNVGDIVGRTIHADGTVIPFTGKPYLKTMESTKHVKYRAMVFTLPDVEVGSIIEYRYATRYDDNAFESPQWYIQGELYLKTAHYEWYPTTKELIDEKQRPINAISWYPLLPPGAAISNKQQPNTSLTGGTKRIYTLDVKDVPPVVEEEWQPPTRSFTYRVLFAFTPYISGDEFWKSEGKEWSKRVNSFADPNSALRSETEKTIAGATTQDAKLRKIYARVMELENTRFTRQHEEREEKAAGQVVKSAADVLTQGRGTPTQLTELFLGMARAAGMKAYAMYVPDRSVELFTPGWLSFQQFDDLIAVVNVDGSEIYFDPGCRYAPYGQLGWQHTWVRGLRQADGGTEFGQTKGESYKANRTTRVANLNMDETGKITGKIDVTYTGAAAVRWRHIALQGDDESLHHALQTALEDRLPKSMEVKVGEIKNLTAYEQPLAVSYTVTGTLGTLTGKRLLMPVDLFMSDRAATFPHEKREQAVYFDYPETTQDAVRVNFKKGFTLEAAPSAEKYKFLDVDAYDMTVTSDDTSFTMRRNHLQGEFLVQLKDYATLRQYYSQMESKDKESVVLKVMPTETAAVPESK